MALLSTTTSEQDGPSEFELVEAETTIGRHPECTIVVDAGAVSRYHAKILQQDDGFMVEDAGSRNGTYVNGHLLSGAQFLRTGDKIRISEVEFTFEDGEVPEFVKGGADMTFEGNNFGILMTDDEPETEQFGSSMVDFRSSSDGLKIKATPEARLEALTRIFSNLGEALSIDEVLPKILSSLCDIFPAADRGFVVMQNSEGLLIPRWVKTRIAQDETETVRISRTIIKQVMTTGEAILSVDATEDSRFDSSQSIADFSIRSMICAPLTDSEGHAFGGLQIDSASGRGHFSNEDADLLAGVAKQIGIVIRNAELHEKTLQQREVEQDLKHATEVQQAFLPQIPPAATGYRVCSYYQAANHIGGDYFDYIPLADGRIAVVVADVVGHGVAAAMFMAKLAAETRFCLASEPDVAKAIIRLNDGMSNLEIERFITFLVVVIDPTSNKATIVNAGHMPPVIRRANSSAIEEPGEEESGLPIAIAEGMDYEAVEIDLLQGDLAVLYTDGINEAMDSSDAEFGIQRVKELTASEGNADEVKDRIVAAVLEHVGDAPPFDDMCLVVIERTANAPSGDGQQVETASPAASTLDTAEISPSGGDLGTDAS
ncbi:MAG: SpoIIE family protein phosphatase [Rubripirellula sp.]|nr:SpoIIE family protein phosphatase [Rubripirellula sp.]